MQFHSSKTDGLQRSGLSLYMSVQGDVVLKKQTEKSQRFSQLAERTKQNVNHTAWEPQSHFSCKLTHSISFSLTSSARSMVGPVWIISWLLGVELWVFSKMKGTLQIILFSPPIWRVKGWAESGWVIIQERRPAQAQSRAFSTAACLHCQHDEFSSSENRTAISLS